LEEAISDEAIFKVGYDRVLGYVGAGIWLTGQGVGRYFSRFLGL
jgi:hypothetical protein